MLAILESAPRLGVAVLLLLGGAMLARGAIRLYLRRAGSVWYLDRQGRRQRLRETRLWAAVLVAVVGGLLGWLLAWPRAGWIAALLPAWPLMLSLPVSLGTVALVAWYGPLTGLSTLIKRGEALLGDDLPGAPPAGNPAEARMPRMPAKAPPARGRRIVILCDGTGNRPPDAQDPAATNVWKLYQALVENETQTLWYDPGVGTGTSRTARVLAATERWAKTARVPLVSQVMVLLRRAGAAWEAMTGTGIGENILDGYQEIVRQYRPGDRIYIFGFSRGAYTARAIAGAIARCGVLKASHGRHAAAALDLYRARRGPSAGIPIRPEFRHMLADPEAPQDEARRHPHVPIEMLGVFDTVAALGAPLWGWWFTLRGFRQRSLSTNPMPNCRHVYHALAMDERRASFFPTLFWRGDDTRRGWNETLLQVWFRGAHADIGGGYPETGLSDITLGWMLEHAERHGLSIKDGTVAALRPDPLARLHDQTATQPSWQMMGTWPRWAKLDRGPPSRGSGITVHDSVFHRADVVSAETGRPDLLDLQQGGPFAFTTEAHRQWDRTGLVIHGQDDAAAWYRLTYLGGLWRDAECPPCGPAGDIAAENPADPRWRARKRRRIAAARWMTLCATIAGPRRWPLRELPLDVAYGYLVKRDPRLLLNQVAPLGLNLPVAGSAVLLRSDRPTGMFYLFANDLWQTVGNNSGALELTLERLPGDPGTDEPLWHLPEAGRWRCYEDGARPPAPQGRRTVLPVV